MEPVSYTHLLFILLFVSYISIFKGIADINLKRVLVAIFKNLSFNNTEPLSPREIAVSYTHLDVYKRQHIA